MPTIHIHGHVLPDGFRITIEHLPLLTWEDSNGRKTTYLLNIVESHIGIEVTTEENIGAEVSQIINQSLELARAAVDGFCFHKGVGLSVVLSRLYNEDGSEQVLVPIAPGVDAILGDKDSVHVVQPGSLDSLYSFMSCDPSIALAFNDLIAAITFPRFAEINCARCVEGIKHLISGPNEMSGSERWNRMREGLNISAEYIKEITKLSRAPRHGIRAFIPPEEVERVIKKSWIIMQRFIEFRSRGKGNLPLDGFPLLVSETLQS